MWPHPCPPGGLWPHKCKMRVHFGVQKSPKWSQKVIKNIKTRHQKRDRKTHRKYLQKASQKYPKKTSFRNVLEQKTSLHPKGPHSLKPTYFLRNNEVHVGQRSERNQNKTSGTRISNARKNTKKYIKKHQKQIQKRHPKVSLKASKRPSKSTLEKTSKKHTKMTPGGPWQSAAPGPKPTNLYPSRDGFPPHPPSLLLRNIKRIRNLPMQLQSAKAAFRQPRFS